MFLGSPSLNPSFNAYYNKAEDLFHQSRKEEAVFALNKALRVDPNNISVHLDKGTALQRLGKNEQALIVYQKAISISPKNYEVHLTKAALLYKLRRFEEAIRILDAVIGLNPEAAVAYKTKAHSLYALNKYKEAIDLYDIAMGLDPFNSDICIGKANTLRCLGQYEEALNVIDKTTSFNPFDARVYISKGDVFYEMSRYKEAIEQYNIVLRLDPGYYDSYIGKGNSLYKLGKYEEALKVLFKGIELFPMNVKNVEAYEYIAKAFRKLGKPREAILVYEKAIILDPNNAKVYISKGNLLNKMGQKQEALIEYEKAIVLDPLCTEAHYNKGHILYDLERKKEAIIAFEMTISLDPDHSRSYYNKANLLDDLGMKKEALIAYDRAISLEPYYARAHYKKGRVLSDLGEKQEAIIAYTEAIHLDPDDPLYIIYRGQCYCDTNQLHKYLNDLMIAQCLTREKHWDDGLSRKSKLEIKNALKKIPELLDLLLDTENAPSEEKQKAAERKIFHTEELNDATHRKTVLQKPIEEDEDLSVYYKVFYLILSSYFKKHYTQNLTVEAGKFKLLSIQLIMEEFDKLIGYAIRSTNEDPNILHNKGDILNSVFKSKTKDKQEISSLASLIAIRVVGDKTARGKEHRQAQLVRDIIASAKNLLMAIKNNLAKENFLSASEQDNIAVDSALVDVALMLSYLYKHPEEICKTLNTLDQALSEILTSNPAK